MKNLNYLRRQPGLLAASLFLTTWVLGPAQSQAQEQKTAIPTSQRRFASPEDATQALLQAVKAGDKTAVNEIFGPEVHDMLTGDEVQDKNNFQKFSEAMTEGCAPENQGQDKVLLTLGTNKWPFPIPLVKQNGAWFFDTAAGREEIINRHIGRDELTAIGVCRAYVTAQRQYFSKERDGNPTRSYALKFKSSPGKHDGLYWDSTDEASPFGALVAEAHAEGYGRHQNDAGPHAFHGYYFRILTSQGRAATGGKINYMVNGNLTGGFALVAYPERWDQSGVMTFLVNQDGKVYQRNLGVKTGAIAAKMTQYNPDGNWAVVDDQGLADSVAEK